MTLDELAEMTQGGNGAMKLRQLKRQQPPVGGLSDVELYRRAQSAADWLRGYAHCLADQGRISDDDFAALWSEINCLMELESSSLSETLDDLATRSSLVAMHLARLRGKQPQWEVLDTPESDRAQVFYVMQRESQAALIAYIDALADYQLIELGDAERLQSGVLELGDWI